MSSRRVEDIHSLELRKLMSDTGLTCVRSAHTPEEFEEIEREEEARIEEEVQPEAEVIPEEETKVEIVEEEQEEGPGIFPTPSLRRLLPDRVRKILEFNRIQVLPDEFNTEIDPQMIPKILQTHPQKYINVLAEITGCSNYRFSLAEYWFLDTLANVLRRAQDDDMNRKTQATLILWFCEWMKEMQYFDAADRKRMVRRFKDNMIEAAKFIGEEYRVPTPQEIGVYYKAVDNPIEPVEQDPAISPSQVSPSVTFKATAYECALRDLTNITHYIYDLFSTDYQYDLIRSVFTFTPDYVIIDAPYQLQCPKKNYTMAKPGKPGKKEKPAKPKAADKKKKPEKEKDVVNPTEDYLALMAIKEQEELELEALQQKEAEDWNRRSKILPLNMSVDVEEYFNKYWPPPPPPPAQPELAEVKKPEKKKK